MYARTTASGVRSSCVTIAMSSARASSIAFSSVARASASFCIRPFSTMPASRSAMARRCETSEAVKSRGCSVCTLSTPTVRSFQTRGTDSIDAMNRRWSMPRTHRKRSSLLTSGMTSESLDSATRPVTPAPNGTRARPIWNRSRPFVAASVRFSASRSSRYSDDTLARRASRVSSTTVSRSSSHVRAVVAIRATRCRKRSWPSCSAAGALPATSSDPVSASGSSFVVRVVSAVSVTRSR